MFLTLDDWITAIISLVRCEAMKHFQVKAVDFLTLIPDYGKAFTENFGPVGAMKGLARSQTWRFINDPESASAFMTYQEDVAQGGQLPRYIIIFI
jgi:hypothetical protein